MDELKHIAKWIIFLSLVALSHQKAATPSRWPSYMDKSLEVCSHPQSERKPCFLTDVKMQACRDMGCCWDDTYKSKKCYAKANFTYPETCAEAFSMGQIDSGLKTLSRPSGIVYDAYCIFTSPRTGYTFYTNTAVKKVYQLNLWLHDRTHFLIFKKLADGSIEQSKIRPLVYQYGINKMRFYHGLYRDYTRPQFSSDVMDKYIFAGVLTNETYEEMIEEEIGFQTNDVQIVYRHQTCSGSEYNSYFAFYPTADFERCHGENLTLTKKFLRSFKPSEFPELEAMDEVWNTMELEFGENCFLEYYSKACGSVQGYAIGLPFGIEGGTCRCSGDPHCRSFDSSYFNFQGACSYTMVQDGCKNGVYQANDATYRVVANFGRRGPKPVSWVEAVTIELISPEARLLEIEGAVVKVDGMLKSGAWIALNADNSSFIRKTFNSITVIMANGVEVRYYTHKATLQIDVPGNMQGVVCGLCGNFNGNPDDDYTMGDATCNEEENKQGLVTNSTKEFGMSWTAWIDEDEPYCLSECETATEPEPVCDGTPEVEHLCGTLSDTDGTFWECIAAEQAQEGGGDLSIFTDSTTSCVYDIMCGGAPDEGEEMPICVYSERIAEYCKQVLKVFITWRNESFCPTSCPTNMTYRSCASNCEPTCLDPDGDLCPEEGDCYEGCFCQTGFVYDNEKCINRTECGCVWEGDTYQVGDSILREGCRERCTCSGVTSTMICEPSECDVNSMCTVQDATRTCVCPPNYITEGSTCVPKYEQCTCAGNLHCWSFDDTKMDITSTCRYTMVRDGCLDGSPSTYPSFRIVADFSREEHPVYHYTRSLDIHITGHEVITLSSTGVKVDGLYRNTFPVNLTSTSGVMIRQSQSETVVFLKQGLQVSWVDDSDQFTITADSSYMNTLCGVCGNFNADPYDDLRMGPELDPICGPEYSDTEGDITTKLTEHVLSWIYGGDDDPGCIESCDTIDEPPTPCPPSDLAKSAMPHCNQLLDYRFQDCKIVMDALDQEWLIDDCTYDVCVNADYDYAILCDQAALQVQICRDKYNISIDWRAPEFCPRPDCPANTTFRECGSVCQPTCFEATSGSLTCSSYTCSPGCFCDDGYVSIGDRCILPSDCGCIMDNVLYEVGETALVRDCTENCTCPSPGGVMSCALNPCHRHHVCVTLDGEATCQCAENYIGDGIMCKATDPREPPCYAITDNCTETFTGNCTIPYRSTHADCGFGVMSVTRRCRDNDTSPYYDVHLTRDCCIKCPPSGPSSGPPGPPGTPPYDPYVITCADVYPQCEENAVRKKRQIRAMP